MNSLPLYFKVVKFLLVISLILIFCGITVLNKPSHKELISSKNSSNFPKVEFTPTIQSANFFRPTKILYKGDQLEVAADEVLIKFKLSSYGNQIKKLLKRYAGQIVYTSPYSGYHRVIFPQGTDLSEIIDLLEKEPLIESAIPNAICKASWVPVTASLYWYQKPFMKTMDMERAWDKEPNASGIVVAVLDSGVAYEDYTDGTYTYKLAPEFVGVPFAQGYDFVNNDAHPNDDHGHGTFMTSQIAARKNMQGIAPGVTIMPVKVLDGDSVGTELTLSDGIYFAVDNGAHVINMSLSFPLNYYPSSILHKAVGYAEEYKVVMVAASGNNGAMKVSYPAAFRSVIAVGAGRLKKDGNLEWAPYSNGGPCLDMIAPGGDMSQDVNKDGYPDGILGQTFLKGYPEHIGYWLYSGTSGATAQVSGAVALLLAYGLEPDYVLYALQKSAKDINIAGFDFKTGVGVIQPRGAIDYFNIRQDSNPDYWPVNYFVNIFSLLIEDGISTFSRAFIEVIDNKGNSPTGRVKICGQWRVPDFSYGCVTTDGKKVAIFDSPLVGSDTVDNSFVFFADLVIDSTGKLSRPQGFYRIEEASLRMLVDYYNGSGLASSPLLKYDQSVLNSIAGSVPSINMQNLGTGLASSPMVITFAVDHSYAVNKDIALNYGTGLASSPMLFNPTLSFSYMLTGNYSIGSGIEAVVLNLTASGSGVASSPMLLKTNTSFTLEEALFIQNTLESIGAGLASSPMLIKTGEKAKFSSNEEEAFGNSEEEILFE